jgi:hypothetical protein
VNAVDPVDPVEPGGGGPARPIDRATIIAELSACRSDLAGLLATAAPDRLTARSRGTAWSNEQLLFHMVFGFLIVCRLLPLVRLVSRLPEPVGRGFAALLEAGRVPFHWVNYAGACVGTIVFDRSRMGWLCDRTITRLIQSLTAEPEERLGRGMPFPTSWDPYFEPFMTLGDVYAYPAVHYVHHRAQLTLAP